MKKQLLLLATLALASCTATKFIPMDLSQTDADRVAASFPGITTADLNRGKQLYEIECSKCHKLKDPVKWDETKWRKIVPAMAAKAKKKAKKEVITPEMQDLILKYAVAVRAGVKG